MLKCPVDINDKVAFKEWLESEDRELHDILQNLPDEPTESIKSGKISEEVYFNLQLRHMRFNNLWNFNNIHHEKENYYSCPFRKVAIPPAACMVCPYGHMAFDCHYPYTCDSSVCNHYNQHEEIIHE